VFGTINRRFWNSVLQVKGRLGRDCNRDHALLVAEVRTKLKVLRKVRSVAWYDWQTLESDIDIRAEYVVAVDNRFQDIKGPWPR